MTNIKIKVKPQENIKNLDKKIVGVQKIKNNLITTKEKINEFTIDDDNNSGEEYAGRRIQNDISYVTRKGIEKSNEIGHKSIETTKQNIIKGKQKINIIKSKIKENKENDLRNTVNSSKRMIKLKTNKNFKDMNNNTKLTGKNIKTIERLSKYSKKIAIENIKNTNKTMKNTKNLVTKTTHGISNTTRATIKAVKSTAKGIKGITALIMAGGWVAIIIILIIALIGGFIATIYNNKGDNNYDSSQITNSEIVLVAKTQLGNEGGEKFWKWYGFEEHVEWCACFVSWCANECRYIDKGIMPKFSFCDDAISWFKEKDEWYDRGESYYPIVGDIIFFDWNDDSGNQDGSSDHVGIVTRTDISNRNIYTIEGNTSNKCAERMYSFDNTQIMGYGSPSYR